MTGTALAAGEQLRQFYSLGVSPIPPNTPNVRADEPDRVYITAGAKNDGIVDHITEVHATGQPILVGTQDVAESEDLHARLLRRGVPAVVLNAKNDEEEARVIAEAGKLGAVTVSTQMAGRGTDIRLGGSDAADDSDDGQSSVTVEDFEDADLASSLQDKTRSGGNVLMMIRMLRPKLLTEELGNKWHCRSTMGALNDDKHTEMLDQAFMTALVQLNQVLILALRANLFPQGTNVSDCIRLLQPVLFNKKIEDLMCNSPDSPLEWLTKPWKMPGVIVFTAIWQLASSLQHASTSSLLTSMMDILSPVSGGTLIEPLAFDTKVEAMLARYRDFLSIEDLCNHLHACIRVELIKKLKDDKSRQGPAYTKAWNACLKVRNRNHVFTMANTERALMKDGVGR
jgi:hypothetical protein